LADGGCGCPGANTQEREPQAEIWGEPNDPIGCGGKGYFRPCGVVNWEEGGPVNGAEKGDVGSGPPGRHEEGIEYGIP
jgi:hypothetical protein